MYYTRAVAGRRIRWLVLRSLVLSMIATPLAARQPAPYDAFADRLVAHREDLTIGGHQIGVTFLTRADSRARQRVVDATIAGLTRLDEWLGPLPAPQLTVVDAPWPSGLAGASYPGLVITSTRWLTTSRDFAVERSLLAALARQYTFTIAGSGSGPAWFEEAVALYLGTLLIHHDLENRNFATLRFFGGMVPFSLRPLLVSADPADPRPRVRHLADVEEPADAPWRAASAARDSQAQRGALALHTFERAVGWPAFQQILHTFIERVQARPRTQDPGPGELATVASEFLGRDVADYFAHAFNRDRRFDHRIDQLVTEARDGGTGYRTVVVATRTADAAAANLVVPVLLRFEDGSHVSERFDAGQTERRLEYWTRSPAVLASVDPDATVLLDEDRTNNTQTRTPPVNVLGVRLALHWVMWLQDAMLAYGALI
jgi:hypothetical protein